MLNRDNTLPNILFFLDDDTKLALRNTSKETRLLLTKHILAPYKSKVDFIIAFDGLFMSKHYFESALNVYTTSIKSSSLKPAMLYKLQDRCQLIWKTSYTRFADGENLGLTGRQYFPVNHAWPVNQAWMLAQLHLGRGFVIHSELSPEYIKATARPENYSALAKEVATAIKAGYSISINSDGLVELKPATQSSKLGFTITDISLSDAEIQYAIDRVNAALAANRVAESEQQAIETVTLIKSLLDKINIDNKELRNKQPQQLPALQKAELSRLINVFDVLFFTCHHKGIALDSFINEFNKCKSTFGVQLPLINKLFFDESMLTQTRNIFVTTVGQKITELYNEVYQHHANGMTYKDN